MSDKYDEAIEFLTANPGSIDFAWDNPRRGIGGCLFAHIENASEWMGCGCLTQIAAGDKRAETDSLTKRIVADCRIPRHPNDITPSNLHVFAEWQRIADKELGRA